MRRVLLKVLHVLLSVRKRKTILNLPKRESLSSKGLGDQLSEHRPELRRGGFILRIREPLYKEQTPEALPKSSLTQRSEKGLRECAFLEYAFLTKDSTYPD